MLASAHRVMMRLHDAVSKGDVGLVDQAERGEDHIRTKFEKATKDDELSLEAAQQLRLAFFVQRTICCSTHSHKRGFA